MAVAPKLDTLVLDHLFSSPVCTVEEVHRALKEKGQRFTVQAIYYEFRKLRERRVVIKAGSRFLLRLPWIVELQERVGAALDRYRAELERGTLIHLFEGRSVLKARSLHDLHVMWNSLVNALFMRFPNEEYYEWSPYAWFLLTPGGFENQVKNQHRRARIPFNLVLGSKCFLNSLYLKERGDLPGLAGVGRPPQPSLARKYVSVHGEGVITVTVDAGTEDRVKKLFETVRRQADLLMVDAVGLIAEPASISIKVELDSRKAERLRREFQRSLATIAKR